MRKVIIKIVVLIAVVLTSCSDKAGGRMIKEGPEITENPSVSENPVMDNTDKSTEKTEVYVQLCGAVNNPGVYKVEDGLRIFEVIDIAGGMSADADSDSINLTCEVTDEMKIYIPRIGESESNDLNESAEWNCDDKTDNQKININTANEDELTKLPGIGQSRAKAIVEYREKNGRYNNIRDIMNISGIKQAMFDKIKDLISV